MAELISSSSSKTLSALESMVTVTESPSPSMMLNEPVPMPRPKFSSESFVASTTYCVSRSVPRTTELAMGPPVSMPRSSATVPLMSRLPPPAETSVMSRPLPASLMDAIT